MDKGLTGLKGFGEGDPKPEKASIHHISGGKTTSYKPSEWDFKKSRPKDSSKSKALGKKMGKKDYTHIFKQGAKANTSFGFSRKDSSYESRSLRGKKLEKYNEVAPEHKSMRRHYERKGGSYS